MTGFRLSEQSERLVLDQPFVLESGEVLPEVVIAYRSWGRLSPAADNAVIVCHALTGSADADDWWGALFGPGRSLDPGRDFIVCANVLGGCYGTTGPTSPAPDGRPWGARFPRLTIRDQVRAQMALADALAIRCIRFVIGGSLGGLQALEWAVLDHRRVGAVVSIAAAGRHSPWCVAWSEAQRLALVADPKYCAGHYDPADPPVAGLAAARAIAMLTYRSHRSLVERFGRRCAGEGLPAAAKEADDFAVKSWLRHHGQALVERFDANSYRVLLDAMDSHDLGRGRAGYEAVVQQIRQPVLIVSLNSDGLYVPADQQELAGRLPAAQWLSIDSGHGHDGFLIDADLFEPAIRAFVHRLPSLAERSIRSAPSPAGVLSLAAAG